MKLLMTIAAAILFSISANAAVVFNSDSAKSFDFYWENLPLGGVIETYETSVGADSFIDVYLDDCCVGGDEFSLRVNGAVIAPTSSGLDAGDNNTWWGSFDNIFLTAGTNTFEVLLSADCCGEGRGNVQFSAATTAAIPEPATWLMMILGFGLVGVATRRRQTLFA
ncbi:hypothetical protein GCM10017044_19620 [Kordiimonas sediminis]|uniref:Ice-binding protein C-terminal domain-containing protein n=1 Tax=Kordiimonas sediminis TaxID=1735581 RepID=A0A919AUR9_9PROT|nr:PEPxxWA-CTERM sorting domain-containing protein [Kordiimonas sediminis]GHF24930.1 hypothetical protein GCM10017044_19620 [Kordiimonas sediminis]